MNIAVAMSGGVDSSVAAALLQKEGHKVIGATMRHFDNDRYGFANNEGISQAIVDAAKVCKKLGIQHHVLEVSAEFYQNVEKNFKVVHIHHSLVCVATAFWDFSNDNSLALSCDQVS